jgi:hypothetical protein
LISDYSAKNYCARKAFEFYSMFGSLNALILDFIMTTLAKPSSQDMGALLLSLLQLELRVESMLTFRRQLLNLNKQIAARRWVR